MEETFLLIFQILLLEVEVEEVSVEVEEDEEEEDLEEVTIIFKYYNSIFYFI